MKVDLALASHLLHLGHVVTVRACCGVVIMLALTQHSSSEVLAWYRGGDVDSVVPYSPHGEDVARHPPAKALPYELEGVYAIYS